MSPGSQHIEQHVHAGRDIYSAAGDQINITIDRAFRPTVPRMLPRDVPNFTGRESEWQLLRQVATQSGTVVVIAIDGAAGIGKTALAVHAAHELAQDFPDGQLYIDLRGYACEGQPVDPSEALEVFLGALGIPLEDMPARLEERSSLLRSVLAMKRMVIVLDNAADESQVEPLLPGAGACLTLVTSRAIMAGLEVNARIELGVLSEAQSTSLLAATIGAGRITGDQQAVATLVRLCGYLPLAVRIAGQLLASRASWPVTRLVSLLLDEQQRLNRLKVGNREVRAALAVSYHHLDRDAARLFRFISLNPGPDITAVAAGALIGLDPDAADLLLDRLVQVHLVEERVSGRYHMHDLIRLFAKEINESEDDSASRMGALGELLHCYLALAIYLKGCLDLQKAPSWMESVNSTRGASLSPAQALIGFESERENLLAILRLAATHKYQLEGHRDIVQELGERLWDPLLRLRHLDDLLVVSKGLHAIAEAAQDPSVEVPALINLGVAYRELRRFDEALACHQRAVELCRETKDRYAESESLICLADTYGHISRSNDALACYRQAMDIRRDLGDQGDDGHALNNLGNVRLQLKDIDGAIDCYLQALEISREVHDDFGEGEILNNLGIAYRMLGRHGDALKWYKDSLQKRDELRDLYGIGQTLNNLANVYQDLMEFDEAVGYYQRALDIRRQLQDRHAEGETLGNLGNCYFASGWSDRAIACYQEALDIHREISDRHGEVTSLMRLSIVCDRLGRVNEARYYQVRASEVTAGSDPGAW